MTWILLSILTREGRFPMSKAKHAKAKFWDIEWKESKERERKEKEEREKAKEGNV